MKCDYYREGNCAPWPYGVIGFTDNHYIVFCSVHEELAKREAARYVENNEGVEVDTEELFE